MKWEVDNSLVESQRTMYRGVRISMVWNKQTDTYDIRLGGPRGRVIGYGCLKRDAVRRAKEWIKENY